MRAASIAALVVAMLGPGVVIQAQEVENAAATSAPIPTPEPTPIPAREIPDRAADIGPMLRKAVASTDVGDEIERIAEEFKHEREHLATLTEETERRRADIPVGVAYGTDPQLVIDILVRVAGDHPEVMSDPSPVALFLGFGDSSLDFELRAWTGANFVQVSSDLRVRIIEALNDARIEIPFPQQDLHLRSVDSDAAKMLSGTPARDETDTQD